MTGFWFVVLVVAGGWVPVQIGPFVSQAACERAVVEAQSRLGWSHFPTVVVPCWEAPPR